MFINTKNLQRIAKHCLFVTGPAATCVLLAVILTSGVSHAATKTWANAAAGGNWTLGTNWGGTAPASGDLVTFGTSGSGNVTVDAATWDGGFGAAGSLSGITFANGAAAFTINLNGNNLNISNPNAIQVAAGVLSNQTIGASAGAGTIFVGTGTTSSTVFFSNASSNCTLIVNSNIANGANATNSIVFGNVNGGTSTSGAIAVSGQISGMGNGVTKNGAGTVTFTGNNTYTGTTTVSAGTLALDFSATGAPTTNIINAGNNTSALTMSGGTLSVKFSNGASANTQRFNGTTVSAGTSSAIRLTQNGNTNSGSGIALGALTRNAGGTVDFSLPSTGAFTSNSTGSAGNNAILANNSVAYATVDGGTWATINSGILGALAAGSYLTDFSSGNDTNISTNQSPAPFTTNTLRFNTSNCTLMLNSASPSTISGGGILVTAAGNGSVIASAGGTGALQPSATGKEIVIHNYANLIVSTPITNNGANATIVTIAGNGTTIFSGANTYSGATNILGGTVKIGVVRVPGVSGSFGANATIVIGAGTLDLNGNDYQIGSLASGGANSNGNVLLGSQNMTIGSDNTSPAAFVGTISGNGGSITKIGNGTLTLGGNNTFTGGITLNSGALITAASASAFGNGSLTINGGAIGSNPAFGGGAGIVQTQINVNNDFAVNGNGRMIIAGTWNLGGAVRNVSSNRTNSTINSAATAGGGTSWGIGSVSTSASITNITNGTLRVTNSTGSNYVSFKLSPGGGNTLLFPNNSGLTIASNVVATQTSSSSVSDPTMLPSLTIEAGGYFALSENTFSAGTVQIFSLSGAGTIANFSHGTGAQVSTLLIDGGTTTANTTFSGQIIDRNVALDASGTNGTVALIKQGSSTQILTGNNTYTGGTTIGGGTLVIAPGGSLTGNVINGGSLVVNGVATGTVSVSSGGALAGNGTVGGIIFGNGGVLDISLKGSNTSSLNVTGNVTIGNTVTDLIPVTVNWASPPADGSVFTILNAANIVMLGSLAYNGVTLADGAQFTVNTGSTAETFRINYNTTGITLTALHYFTATNTITFPGMYEKKIGDADFSMAATASSGLPITYTSLDTSVATIVNGNVRIVGPGIAKIQADQSGDGVTIPPATPIVKYFNIINSGSVKWNRTPENQIFQYSFTSNFTWPADGNHTATATITPTAYLWIPDKCATLKGLIIMEANCPEHMLVGHPILRKTASENSLGIVWFTPQSIYNFNTGYSMNAADTNNLRSTLISSLQTMLNGLASVSGYSEVATVPWIPMGESGALLMVVGIVDGAPNRCIAAVEMKNPQPFNTTAVKSGTTAVPVLMSKGTSYEWSQTGNGTDILTAWNTDRDYGSNISSNRVNYPSWPLTVVVEPCTGHFGLSDQLSQYYANYISKMCPKRLPAGVYDSVSNPLKTIDVTTGFLADPPLPLSSGTPAYGPYTDQTIYPYNSSPSAVKSWFPDIQSAQDCITIANIDWNAQTQLPNIDSNSSNCTVSKYSFNGITTLNATISSAFTLNPMLEPVVPVQFALSTNATLAQSPAGAYTEWLCGAIVPTGNNTYRPYVDRSSGAATYVMAMADKSTNPSIRLSVQPISVSVIKNTVGTAQTISFNPIGDVPVGTSSIPLSAIATSGLPVSFSVISGPAVIRDNNLVFTQIPPNSKFPVQVKVRAWQLGSASNPQVQTATSVDKTFNITAPSSQTITFPVLSVSTVGALDFDPAAFASSGLPVSYSSDNSSVATIVNGLVHIVGPGSANIIATQPGNSYIPAAVPVTKTLEVQISQSITFPSLAAHTVGDPDFNPGATASSNLTVSYSSDNLSVASIVNGKLHIISAGSANITASQLGNATYSPALPIIQPLLVSASYTVLEAWRIAHFGSPNNSGSAADSAMPAGDGIPNLLKFALNLDPLVNQSSKLPKIALAGNQVQFSFTRDPAATGITIIVEVTSDLGNPSLWQPLATLASGGVWTTNGGTSVTDTNGSVTVTDGATVTNSSKRFYRMRVTAP